MLLPGPPWPVSPLSPPPLPWLHTCHGLCRCVCVWAPSDDGTVGPPLNTTVTVTATVVNVNDAPTFVRPPGATISVPENTNGTVVYTLLVADEDVTDTRMCWTHSLPYCFWRAFPSTSWC